MSASSQDRWAALARDLPHSPAAHREAAAALGRQDSEAAEAGLAAAMRLFPGEAGFAIDYARAAERRGDWQAAAARWQQARARFPADDGVAREVAAGYVRTGLIEQAEAVLTEALRAASGSDAADPAIRALMIEHARVAAHRGDRGAARLRWQALMRLAPDDPVVQRGWREAGGHNMPVPDPEDDGQRGPEAPPADAPAPHAPLMLRFEGLGGTCEFGLVQRHFGAEPLGLFRWVGLNAGHLRAALDDGLAGIGDPRFTVLTVSPSGEFSTSDTRYGLGMHTFIRDVGQDQEKLLAQLRRRMRFLRDKLLEDLRGGEKIFVYRFQRNPTQHEMMELLASVRAYHPANRLVVISMLPHGAPGEALRPLAQGALHGAIANGRKPGGGWDIDYRFWLRVCREAEQLL